MCLINRGSAVNSMKKRFPDTKSIQFLFEIRKGYDPGVLGSV